MSIRNLNNRPIGQIFESYFIKYSLFHNLYEQILTTFKCTPKVLWSKHKVKLYKKMVEKLEKTDITLKKAIETLKANDIRWVHSTFVNIRGILQDMVLPAREYLNGSTFNEGIGFDGSSVRGFKSIEESDMIFMPDPKTLAIMPWVTDEKQKSATILVSMKSTEEKNHQLLIREATWRKESWKKPKQWGTRAFSLLN